ncbi:MAG: UvrD-helicase domain-containing protein [Methermicoccaceae archaeon]
MFKLGGATFVNGHPGTGKTTYLAQLVLDLLQKGVPISQIVYTSFSRASARAITNKLMESGVDEDKLFYFRTVHSLSSRLLSLSRQNFVGNEHKKGWCEERGIPYADEVVKDWLDSATYVPEDDKMGNCLFSYFQHLKRVYVYDSDIRKAILQGEVPRHLAFRFKKTGAEALPPKRVLELYEEWEEFKQGWELYEYEDVIQTCLEYEFSPEDMRFLFIDEAQDIYPLQAAILKFWGKFAEHTWIAGDVNQSIYPFIGADPTLIYQFEPEEVVLETSYRLSRGVLDLTKHVAHKLRDYSVDAVKPYRDYEGEHVRYISQANARAFYREIAEGERPMYVLFRYNKHVHHFIDWMKSVDPHIPIGGLGRTHTMWDNSYLMPLRNILCSFYHADDVLGGSFNLPFSWVYQLITRIPAAYLEHGLKTRMKRGELDRDYFTEADMRKMFRESIDADTLKEILIEPKTKISQEAKGYLIQVDEKTKMVDKVDVFTGTIHSAKGLEAKKTLIVDFKIREDAREVDEMRVAYVGISRAPYLTLALRGRYLSEVVS